MFESAIVEVGPVVLVILGFGDFEDELMSGLRTKPDLITSSEGKTYSDILSPRA